MDEYIELETDLELYHNLILFNQEEKLWCYVDLFNTFQYYVLLSEDWDANKSINESYLQLLQKIDHNVPDIHIRRQKHILIWADAYNIEPCTDIEKFKKRIIEAIQKESPKKEMDEVISAKMGIEYIRADKLKDMSYTERNIYLGSMLLYLDEDDRLRSSTFRKVTLISENMEICSYPFILCMLISSNIIEVRQYTCKKFERLNRFLVNANKNENLLVE